MHRNFSVTEIVAVRHQSGTECGTKDLLYFFSFFFFCYFSDPANGCKQTEHNLASDIPPRSGCSFRTLTPASAHQSPHCKMPTFCIPRVQTLIFIEGFSNKEHPCYSSMGHEPNLTYHLFLQGKC